MTELIQVRETLGAKHKLMGRVLEEAGESHDFTKVKAFGDELDTAAKVEKFRELNREMSDLSTKARKLELAEAGRHWQDVETQMSEPVKQMPHPDSGDGTKSIGQRFVESEEYKAFREDRAKGLSVAFDDVELKTLLSTTAGWAPESGRTGQIIEGVTRPIQVLDLIPMTGTGQASVVYMEETTRTHASAEKAEAAAYAESTFELTERSSQVRKVTDSIPVTDEQLEDEPQVRGYLDQRLRFGVRQRLDTQVVSGDGTPPNLRGILNVSGIQTQAKGLDPRFDAIHKAITKVRVTGRANPGAVVLHPNDWEAIRLTRTADGIYILGNPAVAGPMTLFGLPVALGDVMTENTGLVGDFANFCQLHERRGVNIVVGYSGTQFAEGKQLLRADVRVAFVVYRPAAFCTVTGL